MTYIHIVFPTHVGVFLLMVPHYVRGLCLPHARGGVSKGAFLSLVER